MSTDPDLRLVVLADPHAVAGDDGFLSPGREEGLAAEFVRRALFDARADGPVHGVVLAGDLVNDGNQPTAPVCWAAIRRAIDDVTPGAAVVVAPGNHDVDAAAVRAALGSPAGLMELRGYRLVAFDDAWEDEMYCTRPEAQRQVLRDVADEPGGPIVAIQHSPIWPHVADAGYPYMPRNVDAIRADFAAAGVALSLSGHLHAGQAPTRHDGTTYRTTPALCQAPHPFDVVELRGADATIMPRQLAGPGGPAVVDTHAHTELAYCAKDITARAVLDRAARMGLAGVYFVEHSPQLYVSSEDFWSAQHIRRPDLWRDPDADDRMAEFRRLVAGLSGDRFAGIGFEVELDRAGDLVLRDEDRDLPDLLVGAIHWLTVEEDGLTDAAAGKQFLADCERLCERGIDILAHPWRYFPRAKRPVPTEHYAALADMLAASRTATEINHHSNVPSPAFLGMCIERGVKIALGSDAHRMYEAGQFTPHLRVLARTLGSDDPADLATVLYQPPEPR